MSKKEKKSRKKHSGNGSGKQDRVEVEALTGQAFVPEIYVPKEKEKDASH